MERAKVYAVSQYQNVKAYLNSLGSEKPIHLGETGLQQPSSRPCMAPDGSYAADEYKQALYLQLNGK